MLCIVLQDETPSLTALSLCLLLHNRNQLLVISLDVVVLSLYSSGSCAVDHSFFSPVLLTNTHPCLRRGLHTHVFWEAFLSFTLTQKLNKLSVPYVHIVHIFIKLIFVIFTVLCTCHNYVQGALEKPLIHFYNWVSVHLCVCVNG